MSLELVATLSSIIDYPVIPAAFAGADWGKANPADAATEITVFQDFFGSGAPDRGDSNGTKA